MRSLIRSIMAGMVLISGMLFVPGRSFGWGKTWLGAALQQVVNAAHWKLGTLRYNAAFRLENSGYDSDIYFGNSPKRTPDYMLMAGPDFRFFLPLAKGIIVDISEVPQYVFFLRSKNERALNNTVRGQIHFALDRVYFQAGGGMINARERLSTEINLNIRRKENELSGLLFWQVSEGTGMSFQVRRLAFDYENPSDGILSFRENLNRTESYLNLTADFQQGRKWRFFAYAEYGSFVFAESSSSFKDSRSYGLFGGINFSPESAAQDRSLGFQGRLNLGYKRFDILDPSRKDYEGLVANTSLSLRVSNIVAFHGIFSRDIQFSAHTGLSGYLLTTVATGMSFALTKTIDMAYDVSFSRIDYGQLEYGRSTADHYLTHIVSVGFRPQRYLEIGIVASFSRRSAMLLEQINTRSFIGINLTYGYPTGGISMTTNPFSRS